MKRTKRTIGKTVQAGLVVLGIGVIAGCIISSKLHKHFVQVADEHESEKKNKKLRKEANAAFHAGDDLHLPHKFYVRPNGKIGTRK